MFRIPDELLADLATHPGWAELRKAAHDRMEREANRLANEFLQKDKQPDYAALQWKRGFFAGMKFLLDKPTLEARAVAEALENDRRDVE